MPVAGESSGIHGVSDAQPIQRLAAAVIALALEDARNGVPRKQGGRRLSAEPGLWLASEQTCESWISLVTPEGMTPEQVQARLMTAAGAIE